MKIHFPSRIPSVWLLDLSNIPSKRCSTLKEASLPNFSSIRSTVSLPPPHLHIYRSLIYFNKAILFHLPRPEFLNIAFSVAIIGQIFMQDYGVRFCPDFGYRCQGSGIIYSLHSRWTSPSIKPRLKHEKIEDLIKKIMVLVEGIKI